MNYKTQDTQAGIPYLFHVPSLCCLFLQTVPLLISLCLCIQVTQFLHFLWLAPLQALVVMLLLLYLIGPSCLAGMTVLVVLIPVQTVFGRLFSTLRYVSPPPQYTMKGEVHLLTAVQTKSCVWSGFCMLYVFALKEHCVASCPSYLCCVRGLC